MSTAAETGQAGTAWFASPEAAVPMISEMLRRQAFGKLASYYDLTGSDIDRAELESGDFFIRKDKPEAAHPGGFWRYRQPFAPGFRYSGMTAGPGEGVHTIELRIEIDQGEGAPRQVGLDSFRMIHSARGWQILPRERRAKGAAVGPPRESLLEPPWK